MSIGQAVFVTVAFMLVVAALAAIWQKATNLEKRVDTLEGMIGEMLKYQNAQCDAITALGQAFDKLDRRASWLPMEDEDTVDLGVK